LEELQRVMLVNHNMSRGGAQRAMSILGNNLAALGFNLCLCYTSRDREQSAYELDPRIEVFMSQSSFLACCDRFFRGFIDVSSVVRIYRLRRKIRKCKPQLIIAFMDFPAKVTALACRGIKIPVIFAPRGSPKGKIMEIPGYVDMFEGLHKRFAGIVYQTAEQQKQYHEVFSMPENMKQAVIPNAIEQSSLWDRPRVPLRGFIAAVGREGLPKNYPLLLHAFAKAAERFQDCTLNIYGRMRAPNPLENLAGELGVGDRVIFHGFCTDVHERIKDAAVYVMPSIYEGLPNALIEAMCLGLPCITTDFVGGGARALITDGENGLIVPNEDEDALAEAMCRLMDDPDYAEQLGKNAALLREKLVSEKIIPQWMDFMRSVVDDYNAGNRATV